MHPYKLVKDVRTGHESGNVEDVMNGHIDSFLKTFLMSSGQKKVTDKLWSQFTTTQDVKNPEKA